MEIKTSDILGDKPKMLYLKRKLFIISFILLKTILLYSQEHSNNYITIDKNDLFLKHKLFGNIKSAKVNTYSFSDDHANKKLSGTSVYKFNKKKDLVEIEYINPHKHTKDIFHYVYDSNHNIIKEYSNNSKDTTYNYYDKNNRKIETTYFNYGSLRTIYTYRYDHRGRITEETRFDLLVTYSYSDESKNYARCDVFDTDGKTLFESTIFTYDVHENCIKKITTTYKMNEKKESIQEMKYDNTRLTYIKNSIGEFYKSYDRLGAIIKETKTDGVYDYKIVYDKLNNEKTVTVLINNSNYEYYEYFYEYY